MIKSCRMRTLIHEPRIYKIHMDNKENKIINDDPLICPYKPVSLPSTRSHPFDPPSKLAELSQQAPLRRLVYPDGHIGWLVTSYAAVRKVLTDPRFSARSEFKRAPVLRPSIDPFYRQPALPGWMVDMDPPQHTRFRRALSERFSMRRMKELKPRIEQVVCEHLEKMARLGPPVDLVDCFALPVPSLIICELLGVPYQQRLEFQQNSAAIFSLEVSAEKAAVAMDNLTDFLRILIHQKRTHPAKDLLSELTVHTDFSDEEIAGFGVLLLTAGHETTASMLGLGTLALLTNPKQLAKLLADFTLIENTVEELLRYISIFQYGVPRTPLEDIELEGHQIKAGESVTLSIPIANRDSTQFETPNELDITRCTRGHFAFGFGIHYCIGQNLARIEMEVGYSRLFQKFPTLRLAVPLEEVTFNTESGFYGIHRLPVTW